MRDQDAVAASVSGPRFTGALLLVVTIVASAWLGAVVAVNPWSEFDADVFEPLVPNQYQSKVDLWKQANEVAGNAPQVVILGSSRGQGYHPAYFEAAGVPQAFNFAVGGAELADEQAILRYVLDTGSNVQHVVVALDLFQLRSGPSSSLRLHNVADLDAWALSKPKVLGSMDTPLETCGLGEGLAWART